MPTDPNLTACQEKRNGIVAFSYKEGLLARRPSPRLDLLKAEKELTRRSDALARRWRALPRVAASAAR
jgi:hypothetical protein